MTAPPEFWEAIRRALLAIVDAIERHILGEDLTTSEMRRQYKRELHKK